MAGFSLPTIGQPNSTEDTKILTVLTGVNDIAAQYRTLLSASGLILGASGAATYVLGAAGTSQSPLSPSGTVTFPPFVHVTSTDLSVTGLTTTLQLRAATLTNATAPATTFTFGLYPLTVAGGAVTLTLTLGTVVSGSTVAIASPSASSVTRGVATGIALPSDGLYALGVAQAGAQSANSATALAAQLQVHNA